MTSQRENQCDLWFDEQKAPLPEYIAILYIRGKGKPVDSREMSFVV